MKLKQLLLLIILFNFILNQDRVINSCGIRNYSAPEGEKDCKDPNEKFCKYVEIEQSDGNKIRFCAVVHGNYDDEDVWKEVKSIINAKNITVLGSNYLIGKHSIFYCIFFYILLFLF